MSANIPPHQLTWLLTALYSLMEFPFAMNMIEQAELPDYQLGPVIGHGSFATVYRATDLRSNSQVAIKAINMARLNRKLIEGLSGEIMVMKEIQHKNIVQLLEVHRSNAFIYLIMEYCAGGDLAAYLKKRRILPERLAISITKQLGKTLKSSYANFLACALEMLRMKNIVHRDLKPHNLLLSGNIDSPQIKVADFGFARAILPTDMAETLCGSPLYMAPEILRYERYDAKADLWSVGAILYEMIYGRPPYQAPNHIQLQKLIDTSPTPSMPIIATAVGPGTEKLSFPVSDLCISLLQNLLRKNPLQRISFEEFFTHPLLQGDSTTSQLPAASSTYSLPIRKSSSRDAVSSRSGNSSYARSVDRGTSPSDLNFARSLSSLSSSTASIIPPFARLKVGTPPSRISVTPKSSFGTKGRDFYQTDSFTHVVSSDGSRSNPSMRASNLTSGSTPDEASIGLHIESLELREKWAFTQALFELVCQQDVSIDRAFSNWLMPARALHDLCLLAMNEVLDLVRGLQECCQPLDIDLLRNVSDKLDRLMEKVEDSLTNSSSPDPESRLPALIMGYGQKIV